MIKRLTLRNFKCFKEQTLDVGSLTLLTGVNGMGKSSVLQALLLLRQSYQYGSGTRAPLSLNGELVRLGTPSDVLFEGALEEKLEFVIELDDGTEASWTYGYPNKGEAFELQKVKAQKKVFSISLFSKNFHYLKAERTGPKMSFEMSDYQVRERRQVGIEGEYAPHFLAVYGDSKIECASLAHVSAPSMSLKDQVEAWISEITPGTRIYVAEHASQYGLDLVTLRYSFVRGKQVTNQYRSTNVGFGLTYVLPILVAVLSSKPGDTILIENPEAHLHPRGQAIMGEFLAQAASCGLKLLVESHSDHVLNGIRIAVRDGRLLPDAVKIHFFDKPMEDQLSPTIHTPTLNKFGQIDSWPHGFFDELDRSMEKLF